MGEITEKKDRREIYRALITDPQTAGTFKKYSFTEFESKLLSDEKAATSVAQRMVSKGLVPNMDSFFEQYINEPAPQAPQAQQAPSRPVQVPTLLQPAQPAQGPTLTQMTGQQVVTPMAPEPQFQPFQFESQKEIEQAAKSPVFLANKPAMAVMKDREQMAEANPLTWRQDQITKKYGVFEKEAPIGSKPLAVFDNMNEAAAAIKTRGAASDALIMPTKEAEQEFQKMSPEDQQMAISGSTGGKEYQAAEAEKKKSLFQKGLESVTNFAGGFNRAIAKAPSDIVQTFDIVSRKIWEPVLGKTGPSDFAELATKYEKFLNESDFAKEYIGNPEDESLSGSVGSGIGQIATMVGGGGAVRGGANVFRGVLGLGEGAALANKTKVWSEVGKKILSPESLMSFGQVFNSEYQGMKAKGESDEVAFKQGLANAFATAPFENLPIANLAERFQKIIGAPLAARVVNAIIQGGEEASQEMVQQVFSNVTNNQFAQLESSLKDWSDGLSQSGSAGGIVGGLLGAIAGVKAGRVRGKQAPSQLGGIPTQPVPENAPAFVPEAPVVTTTVAPVAPVVTPEAPVVEFVTVTDDELNAFQTDPNFAENNPERVAAVQEDADAVRNGEMTLEAIEDPNYRIMVSLTLQQANGNINAGTSQSVVDEGVGQRTGSENVVTDAGVVPAPTGSGTGPVLTEQSDAVPLPQVEQTQQAEVEEIKRQRDEELNEYKGRRANYFVKFNPDGQNQELTESEVNDVEEIIQAAINNGNVTAEKLFRMIRNEGYVYSLDGTAETTLAYLKNRLNGKTNTKVNGTLLDDTKAKYDAKLADLQSNAPAQQGAAEVVSSSQTEVGKIIGKQFRLLNEGKILDMEGRPIYDMTGGITINGIKNLTDKKFGHSSTRANEEGSLDVLNNILSTGKMEGWFGQIGVEGGGPWTTGKFFIASNNIDGGSKGKIDPSEIEVILNVGLTPFAQELANKYPQTTIKDYNGNVYKPTQQGAAEVEVEPTGSGTVEYLSPLGGQTTKSESRFGDYKLSINGDKATATVESNRSTLDEWLSNLTGLAKAFAFKGVTGAKDFKITIPAKLEKDKNGNWQIIEKGQLEWIGGNQIDAPLNTSLPTPKKSPTAKAAQQGAAETKLSDYGKFLLDQLELAFKKKYPNEKFDRNGISEGIVKNRGTNTGRMESDLMELIGSYIDPSIRVPAAQALKVQFNKLKEQAAPAPASLADQIADLRAKEQAEYDAMPDPNDEAKRKEIYDKYDGLISPLLAQQEKEGFGSLRDVELTMRRPEKNEIVFVPIDALLEKQAADQPSYDIQKEENRIKGRVEKAKEFLKNYLKDQRALNPKTGKRTDAKVSFEPSVVNVDANGKISFEDGRHRVLAAKELGLTEVPIEVPKGKGNAIQDLLAQQGKEEGGAKVESKPVQKPVDKATVKALLVEANDEYDKAKAAFDKKKAELNKTTREDTPDLFGKREVESGLFEMPRISPQQREKAIQPFRDRFEKAKKEVNRLTTLLNKGQEITQKLNFENDEQVQETGTEVRKGKGGTKDEGPVRKKNPPVRNAGRTPDAIAARNIQFFGDPYYSSLQYMMDMTYHPDLLQSIFGGPDKNSKSGRKNIEGERKPRIQFLDKKSNIKTADKLGELLAEKYAEDNNMTVQEAEDKHNFRDIAETIILNHTSRNQMVKAILDQNDMVEEQHKFQYDPEGIYGEDFNEDAAKDVDNSLDDIPDSYWEGMDLTDDQYNELFAPEETIKSPFTAFDPPSESMSKEQGRKARAALKEKVGAEEFRRMDNIHRNGEKMLKELQTKGILEIRCP